MAAPRPGFSITRTLARYSAQERGMQFGQPFAPRPQTVCLPADDHAMLKARLMPVTDTLTRDRAAHLDQNERQLRLAAAGAAVAGLVLGWGLMGSFVIGLALAVGAVAFALIILFGATRTAPRAATRTGIIAVLADHLMGFRVDPDPAVTPGELAALKLFSPVRKVTVDLCLTGQRDGRAVVISRIGLMFGQDKNYTEKQGDGLAFVMVEIALPETAQSRTTTTILATDASDVAKAAQKLAHSEKSLPTGDTDFDARYNVFGDAARVTPALRAGFTRLEAEARCAPTGLTEVPAGTGLRPWVVILPGKLVVLTPLAMWDGAFEPPPFWEPLDLDRLIPAFAGDLAILTLYLNAALSLPLGDIA